MPLINPNNGMRSSHLNETCDAGYFSVENRNTCFTEAENARSTSDSRGTSRAEEVWREKTAVLSSLSPSPAVPETNRRAITTEAGSKLLREHS